MSLQPIRDYLGALHNQRGQIIAALQDHLKGHEKWLKTLFDMARANLPNKGRRRQGPRLPNKGRRRQGPRLPTMIGIPQDVRRLCDRFESDSNQLHAKARAATRDLSPHLGSDWLSKLDRLQEHHRKLLNKAVADAEDWKLMKVDAANDHCVLIDAAYRELKALDESDADANRPTVKIAPSKATHSSDFTSVNWFGKPFAFSKGLQAESVRILWKAWDNGTPSISEQTIREEAGSTNERFRLEHVFKPTNKKTGKRETHPAWGTMIKSAGKGKFALSSP